jgi:hypothetical protein
MSEAAYLGVRIECSPWGDHAPARRCDLGVEVYQLDTKKWVGLARGAGTLYRWQGLDDAEPPSGPKPPNAPEASGRGAERLSGPRALRLGSPFPR